MNNTDADALITRIDAVLTDEPGLGLQPETAMDPFAWTDAWTWTTDEVHPDTYDFDGGEGECGTERKPYGPDVDAWGMPVPVWFSGKTCDERSLTWRRDDIVVPPGFGESDRRFPPGRGRWSGDQDLVAATERVARAYPYADLFHTVAAIMLHILGPGCSVIDNNGNRWCRT